MSVGWKGSYKTVVIYKYRFPVVMAKTSNITVILWYFPQKQFVCCCLSKFQGGSEIVFMSKLGVNKMC